MIEIKLLSNKRCRVKNEEALIIQGEQNATAVTVEFPDESADLHKRVDFKNSEGKKTSLGLYTPELKEFEETADKLKFEFNIPNDMTTAGEMRMQFVGYRPDREFDEKTVLIFEPLIFWVSEGITRLRKNTENTDLLTEMAKFCEVAGAYANAAITTADGAVATSNAANEKSDEAVDTANNALAISQAANEQSLDAVATSQRAEATAQAAEEKSDNAVSVSADANTKSDNAVSTAQQADAQSLAAIAIAERAEAHSLAAGEKSDNAVADAESALKISQEARDIANIAETQSAEAVETANRAEATAQAAEEKSDNAVDISTAANEKSDDAVNTSQRADTQSLFAIEIAEKAEAHSLAAEEKSDSAVADAQSAVSISQQARDIASTAETNSIEAVDTANRAEATAQAAEEKSDNAVAVSTDANTKSDSAVSTAQQADTQSLEAIAIAESAETHSLAAEEKSDNAVADAKSAVNTARDANNTAGTAEAKSNEALSIANNAETIAQDAQNKSDLALAESLSAVNKSNEAAETAGIADTRSIEALSNSTNAVAISQAANSKADSTFAQSADALSQSTQALNTANKAEEESAQALSVVSNANTVAQAADNKANTALTTSAEAKDTAISAKAIAQQAKDIANDADNEAEQALNIANTAISIARASDVKSDISILDSATAMSKSAQAMHFSEQALAELQAAKDNTIIAKTLAIEAKDISLDAKTKADAVTQTASTALAKAGDCEIIAFDAKVQSGAARIAADLAAAAAEEAKQSALASEAYARGLDAQIQSTNDTADDAKYIADAAMVMAEEAVAIAESAEALVASKQDNLGYVPVDEAARNQPDGFAGLDNNGKIPLELINDAMLGNVQYQDLWDAAANIPNLDAVSPKGHYYIVTAGGNRFGHDYNVGDWIISNGTVWDKVDNTDAVASVAGRTGNVVLTKSDVGLNNVDNTSDANKPVSTATQNALNNKVDKVSGKQLSTEDYTSAEKTKLAGIAANANNYTHPSSHAPSIITQDASNRFVSDTEKAAWNAKAETTQATTTSDGLMSAADKAKLNGIAASANNYTHPSSHPASIITQDAANRFVSDTEKAAWNAKAETTAASQSSAGLMSATDKTKLDGVAANANNYTHPSSHAPSIITQDASNRFVSDTEKSTWSGKADKTAATQSAAGLMSAADKTKLDGVATNANNYTHPTNHAPSIITQDSSNRFVTDTEKAAWSAKAEKTTASQTADGLMSAADKTKLDTIPTVDDKSTQVVSSKYEVKGYGAAAVSTIPMKNAAGNGFDWLKTNAASGIPILNASGYLTQLALYARADESGNTISSYYLPKNNGTATGYLAIVDTNSKLSRGTTSPAGNNIGVTGVMLTHYASDEGGILINEDGAYLWNSTDSGSLFRGLDEDIWTSATTKYNATFSTGLMFDFDSSGNLKLKGNIYVNNGATQLYNVTSLPASSITVNANSNLGGYTNLQDVLNYIANVFAGTQKVTKLKASSFDTD